jgi:glutamine amidotransferase
MKGTGFSPYIKLNRETGALAPEGNTSVNVTVIDYKAGNLTSVVKSLRHLGAEVTVTDSPQPLAAAERIVLPGVGHFAATRRLDETGLTTAIRAAIAHGIPFLGICVGMQWLLEGSTEAPNQPGLGYFLGHCDRFPEAGEKVPHVGWNQLDMTDAPPSRLFTGIRNGEHVYFTHSYCAPINTFIRNDQGEIDWPLAAQTHYIKPFASAVEYNNIFGVQFHPEKSGETGLKILKNFLSVEGYGL